MIGMAISDIEASRLRREWRGGPCSHPNVEREVIPELNEGGQKTGDWVCTTCGEEVPDPRPPREDAVQAARRVVDEATGERPRMQPEPASLRLRRAAEMVPELRSFVFDIIPGPGASFVLQLAGKARGELVLDDEKSAEEIAADIRDWLRKRVKK
jgi:hypothetical protein